MATNHTTNYNLNLWEANDKFVREEFNENTSKLDAAIKAVDTKANTKADQTALTAETNARTAAVQSLESRKAGFVLLKEVSVSSQVTELNINVSDINWGAWQYVFMDIEMSGHGRMKLLPNGSTAAYYNSGSNYNSGAIYAQDIGTGGVRLRFDICKRPDWIVRAMAYNMHGYASLSYQDLSSIKITANDFSSYYIGSGTVRFWGLA